MRDRCAVASCVAVLLLLLLLSLFYFILEPYVFFAFAILVVLLCQFSVQHAIRIFHWMNFHDWMECKANVSFLFVAHRYGFDLFVQHISKSIWCRHCRRRCMSSCAVLHARSTFETWCAPVRSMTFETLARAIRIIHFSSCMQRDMREMEMNFLIGFQPLTWHDASTFASILSHSFHCVLSRCFESILSLPSKKYVFMVSNFRLLFDI